MAWIAQSSGSYPVPTAQSSRAHGDRECTVGGQRRMTRTCARLVKAWWRVQLLLLMKGVPSNPRAAQANDVGDTAGSSCAGGEAKRIRFEGDRDEPNDTKDDVDNAPDPTPKRPRGLPPTRVLPDPRSDEFTLGSSGCLGTSCRHSKWCQERRVISNPRRASTYSRRSSSTALKRSADTDDPPVRSQAHLHGTSGTQQRHQLQCQENG